MDIGKNYNHLKQWNYLAAEKKVIDRTNNEGNVSNPEVVVVVLVHCNSVDNRYQQTCKLLLLYTFTPNY